MNQDTKSIIDAVLNNNLHRARQAVEAALRNDRTKKDEWYCQDRLAKLEKSSALDLPYEVKKLLTAEVPANTFHLERYYLTDRERDLAERIQRHNQAAAILAERDIRYCNATLLHGASGTGKTTFARYLAYHLGLPLMLLNLSNVLDSYLGGSQKNISQVFSYVTSIPCVFCVDEIDAIGMSRGDSHDVTEVSRVTIALMQALDNLPNHVVLVATTNRKDKLDDALIRRFTTIHEVTPLEYSERINYIEQYAAAIGLPIETIPRAALAQRCPLPAHLESHMIAMLVNRIVESQDSEQPAEPDQTLPLFPGGV